MSNVYKIAEALSDVDMDTRVNTEELAKSIITTHKTYGFPMFTYGKEPDNPNE
ncbi:hypothetical protein [Bacillus velezensis]|uniref:hypothetical protein n=1 Tax=Bacillus velezensis TaxID=492670 RepID=UPI002DBCDBE1|nr:hypothetical protein [Bacillus velezensis]MEC3770733.1 hypothetical protein [Bacillus velezensis]